MRLYLSPSGSHSRIAQVLVNGAEGIGTGWATSVPNFNIRDIIANCRKYIKGQELKETASAASASLRMKRTGEAGNEVVKDSCILLLRAGLKE